MGKHYPYSTEEELDIGRLPSISVAELGIEFGLVLGSNLLPVRGFPSETHGNQNTLLLCSFLNVMFSRAV